MNSYIQIQDRLSLFLQFQEHWLHAERLFYLQFLFLARKEFLSPNDFAFFTPLKTLSLSFLLLHQLFERLEYHSRLDLSYGGFAQQASFMYIHKSQ